MKPGKNAYPHAKAGVWLMIACLLGCGLFAGEAGGVNPSPGAGDVSDACRQVAEAIRQAEEDLGTLRDAIMTERVALRNTMLRTEKKINELNGAVKWLKEEEASLTDRLRTSEDARAAMRIELRRLHDTLMENRKEFESYLGQAMPVEQSFEALDEKLMHHGSGALIPESQGLLWTLYERYFSTVSGIQKTALEVVLPDGSKERGELLLCAGFGGLFWGERGSSGFVYLPPEGGDFHLAQAGALGMTPDDIKAGFSGRGQNFALPCDISGGMALARLKRARTWLEFLKAGGILVLPICLIALLALGMIIERLVFLARIDTGIDHLLARVLPLVRQRDFDAARAQAKAAGGPVGRILLAGIEGAREGPSAVDAELEDAMLREMPGLERFKSTLGVFAAITPLLGLLGTVSGMIKTFQVIQVYGTGHSQLLSGGISEALITTEVGLAVAVPILLAHAWLSRRVKHLLGHMDRAAISFAGAVALPREAGPDRKPLAQDGEADRDAAGH